MSEDTSPKRDDLYAKALGPVPDFAFDESVARVFPDMIRRSVPGYTTIIPMLELIAHRYYQVNTVAYDLGCSLGASTLAVRHGLKQHPDAKIIAIDNSEAMLEKCNHYIELDNAPTPVDLVCQDIDNVQYEKASVIVLNFTLQFIPLEKRSQLLARLNESLVPGGVLVLSEKVRSEQSSTQTALTSLHEDFKRANGYSDLEISQKRSAIENVLIPETLSEHQTRLTDAGFSAIHTWYQCFNFISLIAVK
ncbi:MAG: carboxy-S-adenosyl-L-methionine synthase CmoA [Pseudomonadales bacterium]|nr:carboxy-S-adenosyl-L-methionine synthase CmoA [Pseudomonadales bacterium]